MTLGKAEEIWRCQYRVESLVENNYYFSVLCNYDKKDLYKVLGKILNT